MQILENPFDLGAILCDARDDRPYIAILGMQSGGSVIIEETVSFIPKQGVGSSFNSSTIALIVSQRAFISYEVRESDASIQGVIENRIRLQPRMSDP